MYVIQPAEASWFGYSWKDKGNTLPEGYHYSSDTNTQWLDINGIKELARITVADGKLRIGACVRHAAFYQPVCEGPLGTLLATVVRKIGHHPIRIRGTFCGSVAHADPAVNVIIPTHNRRHRLQCSLDALSKQTLPPEQFEVIVGPMGALMGTMPATVNARLPRMEGMASCQIPGRTSSSTSFSGVPSTVATTVRYL